jgi:hypothetical protein
MDKSHLQDFLWTGRKLELGGEGLLLEGADLGHQMIFHLIAERGQLGSIIR